MREQKIIKADRRVMGSVESIVNLIESLSERVADSLDLKDLLNNAISVLLSQLPNGTENYAGENPKIGNIVLSTLRAEPEEAELLYGPSEQYEKMFGYVSRRIARVNLRKRTFSPVWKEKDYDERKYEVPRALMEDVDSTFPKLGLVRG